MKKPINELRENEMNPRYISDEKLKEIKKSLKEFPKMLELRPIVINEEGVILGGNMRWRAAKELGWTEVDCVIMNKTDKEYEFMIKDNLSYGEWAWASLIEDYKSSELVSWGVDIPVWFKDLEDSVNGKKETQNVEKVETEKPKDEVKSNKKALYLFYSQEDKSLLVEKLDKIRNERTNEEIFMDLIKTII